MPKRARGPHDEGPGVCHSYWAGKRKVFTSVSIGIALSNSSYEQAEDYSARLPTLQCTGPNLWAKHVTRFLTRNMRASVIARLQLETDLRQRPSKRKEFRNFLSADCRPSLPARLSALRLCLRWQHPKRGLLGPEEFIPVAEETGLIRRNWGWWKLAGSLPANQRVESRSRCPFSSDDQRSNLSAQTILQPNLVSDISKLSA